MNHWLPFEWIAAVRFLREGRLQTIFIVGGISIGVGVIVFMSAMLAGLEANFIKRVLTSQPQSSSSRRIRWRVPCAMPPGRSRMLQCSVRASG